MRKAIVTGAQSGIGAACVARLEQEGIDVVSFDLTAGVDYQIDVSEPATVEGRRPDPFGRHPRR
jgi:NAD(P)-dependent dehydrogenase (short-subunit alcohol dehydrogenase family)